MKKILAALIYIFVPVALVFASGISPVSNYIPSSVTITGGAINNTTIGAASAASGKFTTLETTGLLTATSGISSASAVYATAANISGLTTTTGGISSASAVYATAANISGLTTTTGGISSASAVYAASAVISAGTINNTIVGATTAASGRFTTLTATGSTTLATSLTGTLRADSGVVSVDANNNAPVLMTKVASTSGTSIDFTGIPSWATQVVCYYVGVSTNGVSNYLLQIGDSGGIEATGYLGSSGSTTFTTGVGLFSASAANVWHGTITLNLADASTNTWTATVAVGTSNSGGNTYGGISKPLSATLDRVRFTTAPGTETFDAGFVNVSYR